MTILQLDIIILCRNITIFSNDTEDFYKICISHWEWVFDVAGVSLNEVKNFLCDNHKEIPLPVLRQWDFLFRSVDAYFLIIFVPFRMTMPL